MSLDPFTILLAFNIVMLAGVILLLPLCLLEARYMDEPGEPRRPTFPPAVRLGDRDLRDLYTTHTDLAQKPDGKGRTSE